MALRGGFRVGEVWHGPPEKVWRMVSELAGVNKLDFDTYFEGQTIAYALEITEVWTYPQPISLETLRGKFSNFAVPQSWRYVRTDEYQFFQKMKPQTETCLEQHQRLSQPLDPQVRSSVTLSTSHKGHGAGVYEAVIHLVEARLQKAQQLDGEARNYLTILLTA